MTGFAGRLILVQMTQCPEYVVHPGAPRASAKLLPRHCRSHRSSQGRETVCSEISVVCRKHVSGCFAFHQKLLYIWATDFPSKASYDQSLVE